MKITTDKYVAIIGTSVFYLNELDDLLKHKGKNNEFLVFEMNKGRTFKLETKVIEIEKFIDPTDPNNLRLNSTFIIWNNGLTYKVEHKEGNYIRYRCVEKGYYKSRTKSILELASFPQFQIVEL